MSENKAQITQQSQADAAMTAGRFENERSLVVSFVIGEALALLLVVADNLDNALKSFRIGRALVGVESESITGLVLDRERARFTTAKTALRRAAQTLQAHPGVPRDAS